MKNLALLLLLLFSYSINHSQTSDKTNGLLLIHQADSMLKIDPNEAIRIAEKAINMYGDNSDVLLKSYLTLGFAYQNKSEYDSSILIISKGIEKALSINDTIKLILLHSNIGQSYFMKADYTNTLLNFRTAKNYYKIYAYGEGNEDLSAMHHAKILNNIATAYIKTSKYDSALIYFIKSLKIREEDSASAEMLIVSKFNIGSLYIVIGDYENGEKWISKVLDDAIILKDSNMMAKCYSNLGISHKKLGNSQNAIDSYMNGLAIHESLNNERDIAVSLQNIALLYISQDDTEKAINYFYKALSANDKINSNNSGVHLGLSELYLKQKRYDSTIIHGRKALTLAEESGNITSEIESLYLLYQAYEKQNKFSDALASYENYNTLQDSVLTKENNEYIQKLKEEFETERKEEEIIFLKKLNESENIKAKAIHGRQQLIIISIVLAFALLMVISISFYFKRKKEKELHYTENKLLKTEVVNKELISGKLKKELQFKTKQLTSHALNMTQKNQMLETIVSDLKEIAKKADNTLAMEFKTIIRDINQSRKTDSDWDLFKKYFEDINKDFNDKLTAINPNLSTNDFRLAALISLNLNIKETAALLNISPNSVKLARHRLRQRLAIKTGVDLHVFLHNL